jgi:hypothetical protein
MQFLFSKSCSLRYSIPAIHSENSRRITKFQEQKQHSVNGFELFFFQNKSTKIHYSTGGTRNFYCCHYQKALICCIFYEFEPVKRKDIYKPLTYICAFNHELFIRFNGTRNCPVLVQLIVPYIIIIFINCNCVVTRWKWF